MNVYFVGGRIAGSYDLEFVSEGHTALRCDCFVPLSCFRVRGLVRACLKLKGLIAVITLIENLHHESRAFLLWH